MIPKCGWINFGAVHKRRLCVTEEDVCPLWTRDRELFRWERPHFLLHKTSDFWKFMLCPHGQEGLSQCGHFSDKKEGRVSFFWDFERKSFLDGCLAYINQELILQKPRFHQYEQEDMHNRVWIKRIDTDTIFSQEISLELNKAIYSTSQCWLVLSISQLSTAVF